MATQQAIIVGPAKDHILVHDWPLPTLRDDTILVKTVAVALNPTDWKSAGYAPAGLQVGCDYAGIVVDVGKNVRKPFKKGDRVCGIAHGANRARQHSGAFSEFIVALADVAILIPDNLTFQEAATLGVGITTVGQALYQSLKLALPTEPIKEPVPILIYGGSTATGTLAIQFAKLSGYTVLTTCSPGNFELVKKLGADAVFDYNDPDSAAEIRRLTNNNLKLVLDTVALPPCAAYCEKAISTAGGEYSALLGEKVDRANVNSRFTLGYTVFGEELRFGDVVFPASQEDREFGRMFWDLSKTLLGEGKVVVHPVGEREGGLEGVLDGMRLMKEGKVSGEKLVYTIGKP